MTNMSVARSHGCVLSRLCECLRDYDISTQLCKGVTEVSDNNDKSNSDNLHLAEYYGLANRFFNIIDTKVKYIMTEHTYKKRSQAFAHWFLTTVRGLEEENVSQLIVDDFGDWSIDAVNIDYDDEVVELYQFKFPDIEKNINKKIGKDEILSFLHGYNICAGGPRPRRMNKALAEKLEEIKDSGIFSFNLVFVSFSEGLSQEAEDCLASELQRVKNTGNDVAWTLFDKVKLTHSQYHATKKQQAYTVELAQIGSSTGVFNSENSKSYSIYCRIADIADMVEKHGYLLFDENVRLFHGSKSQFNSGIIDTASSEEATNFHLYNNGIVIVSPKVQYLDPRKTLKVTSPKVVNGCQTMNCLAEAKSRGQLKDGFVLVRVIEILDPRIRDNITVYLNSQTEIKDSYLISNLPTIRQLEEDLALLGWYFERQANQLEDAKKLLTRKEKTEMFGKESSKVIRLEPAIQVYAAFFDESLAPIAKLNKTRLFTGNIRDKLLKSITAERVILAHSVYTRILGLISSYRKGVRDPQHKIFRSFLSITRKQLKDYAFLNTADLFLLSVVSKLAHTSLQSSGKREIPVEDLTRFFDDYLEITLKAAIDLIKRVLDKDVDEKAPAILLKSQSFHKALMFEATKVLIQERVV